MIVIIMVIVKSHVFKNVILKQKRNSVSLVGNTVKITKVLVSTCSLINEEIYHKLIIIF